MFSSIKELINFLSDRRILIVAASVLLLVSLKYPKKFYTKKSAMFVFGAGAPNDGGGGH